ncbi:Uncharacterised protein [Mycobacteroides abscessus subsp. abscessus]|nr:Uncharacterised protein [Mycobacteroides abscessus subsp. abscessus]
MSCWRAPGSVTPSRLARTASLLRPHMSRASLMTST